MAYNGIGLTTPRGSGTSGYVQRNLGSLRPYALQRRQHQRGPEDYRAPAITKKPNKAILEHNRKRKIELKLVLLAEELKSRGLEEEEIEKRVAKERKYLRNKLTNGEAIATESESRETHAVSFLKEQENEKMRRALGLRAHIPGEAFRRMEKPEEDDKTQPPKAPQRPFLDRGGEQDYRAGRRDRDRGRARDQDRDRDRDARDRDRDRDRGRDRDRRDRDRDRDRDRHRDIGRDRYRPPRRRRDSRDRSPDRRRRRRNERRRDDEEEDDKVKRRADDRKKRKDEDEDDDDRGGKRRDKDEGEDKRDPKPKRRKGRDEDSSSDSSDSESSSSSSSSGSNSD